MFFCDADIDVSKRDIEKLGAKIIDLKYEDNGKVVVYEPKKTYNYEDFYSKLKLGQICPVFLNPNYYITCLEPYLKKGEDVCYFTKSSKLNFSYNYIKNAIDILQEKYPNQKVVMLDTLNVSSGYGEVVLQALKHYEKTKNFDETIKFVKNFRRNVSTYFMIDEVNDLKRVVSVPGLSAINGKIVSVKPILAVNRKGELNIVSKPVGTKKALAELANKIVEFGQNINDYSIYVVHANNNKLADKLKQEIYKIATEEADVKINQLCPIYAIYCGENTIGISFHSKIKN